MRPFAILLAGFLFLGSCASADEQSTLSDDVKTQRLVLVRNYLEASEKAIKSNLAATEAAASMPRAEELFGGMKVVEARFENLPGLPYRQQCQELANLFALMMEDRVGVSRHLRDVMQIALMEKKARIQASEKSKAASALLDFQSDLIEVLTDHRIETRFADLEP